MDLRTKLVFALVAVSLVSMLALGALAYNLASGYLTHRTERQLDSLAETKKEELGNVIQGWQDRVSLIASRTQLRESLRTYDETEDLEAQDRIGRILSDAYQSSELLLSLTVYDRNGRSVSTAGETPEHTLSNHERARLADPDAIEVSLPEIFFTAEDEPRASLVAPLLLENERIGALHVVLSTQDLVDLTENFIGLGDTGETLIVMADSGDVARVLHPVRHGTAEQRGPVRLEGAADPAYRALRDEQGLFTKGLIDYRGEPVWAATRYLPEVRWGVVVKFDAAEERAPILEFRRQLTAVGMTLSAFAIVFGIFLGWRLGSPIRDLADVAERIRMGQLGARAKAVREEREDELGLLARTFNKMAEVLERNARQLEEQVTLLNEFQKYFDLSLDMLCIAGTDGYFKRVNPAFERILGWSTEELLSRPFLDFVHPDDVDATLHEIEKLAQGIPTVSFENRYRCADGSYKHLIWNSYPEPETGVLYAIARDVTELRQGQDRPQAGDASEARDPA